MTRTSNFYYQDPTAEISSGIVRAIFGDPEMKAKQEQQRAEMDRMAAQTRESDAHAGVYNSQSAGQNTSNTAQTGLPQFLATFLQSQQPPAPPPSIDSAAFGDFNTPLAMPAPQPDKGASLAALIGAMGQMNGDKIDPRQIMGTLGAFGGGDELARRGLVAQGQTPTDDFALTSGRADEIAGRDAAAKQREAWGVANINHANDIPVANIQRRSAFDVAGVNNASDIPVANIQRRSAFDVAGIGARGKEPRGIRNRNPGNIEFGDFARSMGATGSDGRFAIFPTPEAGVRAQEALLGGPGYLGGGRNTIHKIVSRYAPAGENSVSNYAGYISRVTGIDPDQPIGPEQIPVVAAAMRQFENGAYTGTSGKPGKRAAADTPKPITKSEGELIQGALRTFLENRGMNIAPQLRETILARAITHFQQSGNPVDAVAKAAARLRKVQPGGSGQPPIMTPEQVRAAPSGTKYRTSDGRSGTRP